MSRVLAGVAGDTVLPPHNPPPAFRPDRHGQARLPRTPGRRAARLARDETAQDLIEYALLCAILSLAIVTILPHLTRSVNERYDRVGTSMRAVTYECAPDHQDTSPERSPEDCS